ncbi:MAG: hypothetical protein ACPL1F_04480, partial [bacterium]
DIQNLLNFENVIKVEKFIKQDNKTSDEFNIQNQINSLDFSNVLKIYEMYYKELKADKTNQKDQEAKLKKILNKLEEIINKDI